MNASKVYKSKVDSWLAITSYGSVIIPLILLWLNRSWLLLVVLAAFLLFIHHLFTNTFYEIGGGYLRVKSGLFFKKKISINGITKVGGRNTLLAAPALSQDRLELFMGRFDSIIISPKEKELFIKDLIAINPTIKVEL